MNIEERYTGIGSKSFCFIRKEHEFEPETQLTKVYSDKTNVCDIRQRSLGERIIELILPTLLIL